MSEELIKKNALISTLKNWLSEDMTAHSTMYGDGYDDAVQDIIKLIETEMPVEELRALPAAQPKTGRWILDTTQFLPEYVCTNCKSRFPLVASGGEFYSTLCCENMNYCPFCGAKVEKETKRR